MAQPYGLEPKTMAHIVAGLPIGAIMAFLLLGIEAWRAMPDTLQAPHVDLKPWQMPTGLMQFVLATFLFSAFWGVVLGSVLPSSDFREPLFILAVSIGGLAGIIGVYHAFQSRFSA